MSTELERLVALGELAELKANRITELEAELREVRAVHNRLTLEDLPTLMAEVGLSDFRLTDGTRVTCEEDVKTGITAEDRPAAMDWLRRNGFAGLIKTRVVASFGRGDYEAAAAVVDHIAAEHDEVSMEETVHPSTLKSWVKEQLAAGRDLPWDLFSIHPFNRATLKRK